METKTTNNYDVSISDTRLKEILDSTEAFDKVNEIPPRDKLTYSNGFNVNCTAVFIDIRESSKLPETHNRPVLGKIYRAYLSECVSIMNNDPNCREIVINGDCVSGIINTPKKSDIDRAFGTAYSLNSLINLLNWRLVKKGYTPIKCGIGIAYGRALMMKAGYKGSGINEVIWMGSVVNESSNLCHQGNKGIRQPIQVSITIYENLSTENKNFLSPVKESRFPYNLTHYECDVINIAMNNWLSKQKQQSSGLTRGTTTIPSFLGYSNLE